MSSTQYFEYFFGGKETPFPKTAFPLVSFNFTPSFSAEQRHQLGTLGKLTRARWVAEAINLVWLIAAEIFSPVGFQHFKCGTS